SPAAERRGAMMCRVTTVFMQGAAWSRPALCQRSCRPRKAPGTRLSAGASGRFARGTAHEPVSRIMDGQHALGDRTEQGVADMENRSLGRGRISVPVVGLGTWRRLEAAAAAGRHRELTGAAIAAGIGLFDTSPMYGDAERLLAGALDGQRGQVLIADKIWTPSAEEG